MLDKKQLNKLLFISVVYSSFAEIYSVLDDSPLDELPDELRDDSKNILHEFENLLEKYNDYIQNAVDNSGLED